MRKPEAAGRGRGQGFMWKLVAMIMGLLIALFIIAQKLDLLKF